MITERVTFVFQGEAKASVEEAKAAAQTEDEDLWMAVYDAGARTPVGRGREMEGVKFVFRLRNCLKRGFLGSLLLNHAPIF